MHFLNRMALVAMMTVGSLMAQTSTEGTVKSITYNSVGLATSFVMAKSPGTGEVTFTFETPSEQMTENLNDWKANKTKITVKDQDSDTKIEVGDTITA